MSTAKPVFTAQTLLDELPPPTLIGCHNCNPEIKENGVCDPCWDKIQARLDKLRTHPEVVAIRERLATLTLAEKQRLSEGYWANYRIYRNTLTSIHHRIVKAYEGKWRDLFTVAEEVWQAGDQVAGVDLNGMPHAARDAAYAALAGDLLTADERRMYTGSWDDVIR